MRRILIVTYVWPPFGHAPVQRVLRFCKYLPEFGWQPVVLTVANPTAQMQTGETGAGIVEKLPVFHAPTIEPPTGLKTKLRNWLRRKQPAATPPGAVPLHAKVQVLDTHVGWAPLATLRGWPLVHRQRIDAIFVSAPPFSSLLAGRWLAALTGRPWVPDFRDEWCGFLSFGYEAGARNRFAERLEAGVVRSAARVVSVSNGITENFQRRYPALAGKFVTITNGFDPDDFPPALTAPHGRTDRKLRITFIGTIVRLTTPRHVLAAVTELAREDARLAEKLELHFYGRATPEEQPHFAAPELRGIVHVHGYLPHGEVPRVQAESDILLVLLDEIPGAERVPTAKIFEYLAARRYILAVVPEGETARFVRECGAGEVIAPGNGAGLREFLRRAVAKPALVREMPGFRADRLEQFSRKTQAKQLATVLAEAVSSSGG